MNTFGGTFVYAIVGLIICSTAAYYTAGAPVVGGVVGAALGAGGYLLANRKK